MRRFRLARLARYAKRGSRLLQLRLPQSRALRGPRKASHWHNSWFNVSCVYLRFLEHVLDRASHVFTDAIQKR